MKMAMASAALVPFLLIWLIIMSFAPSMGLGFNHANISTTSMVLCRQTERDALLKFKHDLTDPSRRLASWIGDHDVDCCSSWVGVICDNVTGHVTQLHLRSISFEDFVEASNGEYIHNFDSHNSYRGSMLGGKINPSLVNLKHLMHLDLSNNDFGGIHIPKFLGSIGSLQYLNLSGAGFGGMIPYQLGNLSALRYLDLYNDFYYGYPSYVENLRWLSGLTSLEFLDLSRVNLSKAFDWLVVLNALPSLEELHLPYCQLPQYVPPLPNVNFSSLSILDLSYIKYNPFSTLKFPTWVLNLKKLTSLSLPGNNFEGPIPNDLQNMTSLRELDLFGNNFNSSIPKWLYGFRNLELLHLGGNYLHGEVSSDIGNMTSLISLHLSSYATTTVELRGGIPTSFRNLCNLRELVLNEVVLNQDIGEILEILVPDKLESLELSGCQLFGQLTNQLGQFKNLVFLWLESNLISGPIPRSIGELESLRSLVILDNKLNGSLPDCFEGLKKLDTIDIRNNMISGPIPWSFGELDSLMYLWLSDNKLNGSLPASIGALTKLESMEIDSNSLEGDVSEIHLANLTRLRFFYAGGNQLVLRVNHTNWIPPLQLRELDLRSWNVGTQFPLWLCSLKQLAILDLSNSTISSSIPVCFWKSFNFSATSVGPYLNLSHNQIHGSIPHKPKPFQFSSVVTPLIDMSSNHLKGQLPLMFFNITALDLSNNAFSGSLSNFLCYKMNHKKNMQVLNLENNLLSGDIPDCWMSWQYLVGINLSNNKLRGEIPRSIGITLSPLESLHLRHNNISGELPMSLRNCTQLVTLDVGENELVGNIPAWIGEAFSSMLVLRLRANKFHGHIPKKLCNLASLQLLDIAHNHLSGSIPTCINNFTAMATRDDSGGQIEFYANASMGRFVEDALLVMKGKVVEYNTILKFVRSIDLSNNNLYGKIPDEIITLGELISLNLSGNSLTGIIPTDIGSMRSLESIDFSFNQLSGKIPSSISSLTFLSHLNLSNNKLWGEIPSGTQIQSFDASSFGGNELCGLPLSNNCSRDAPTPNVQHEKGEGGSRMEINWFYVSVALGFIVGFWSAVGSLLFNRRWRYAYFRFFDRIGNKIWWRFK